MNESVCLFEIKPFNLFLPVKTTAKRKDRQKKGITSITYRNFAFQIQLVKG